MRLAKERERFCLPMGELDLGKRCWMALPSSTRSFHIFNLFSRQVICSSDLEVRCGFCRSRMGRTLAARRAVDSIEKAEAKAE